MTDPWPDVVDARVSTQTKGFFGALPSVRPYRDRWFENGDSTYTNMEIHFISIINVWLGPIMKAVKVESPLSPSKWRQCSGLALGLWSKGSWALYLHFQWHLLLLRSPTLESGCSPSGLTCMASGWLITALCKHIWKVWTTWPLERDWREN